MKRILTIAALLALTAGCAQFNTKQTDISYDDQGKPARAITTKVTAYTLFDANSTLVKSKALNTDKSQSAELGGLNQSATGTNVVEALRLAASIAASAAK